MAFQGFIFSDKRLKNSIIFFLYLGYPNNPGPSIGNPGGLSLKDLLIVPQIGVGLAFVFRTDNSGIFFL
jgi:hypothetical protein